MFCLQLSSVLQHLPTSHERVLCPHVQTHTYTRKYRIQCVVLIPHCHVEFTNAPADIEI